jgi:urease accessory protein
MSKKPSILAALQHSDSFFPSGAVSFSWGLETLATENRVSDAETVEKFIRAQLTERWASFDRSIVSAGFDSSEDLVELRRLDSLVESQTLASEMRDGSHRCGQALLRVHEEMETPYAKEYRDCVANNDAHGNLTVMQGFLWANSGVAKDEIGALSAHTMCVGMLGAAMRLGCIGHIHSQRILASLHHTIEDAMREPPPPLDRLHAFTPVSEIAMMRHEIIDSRLFAN